MSDSVVSVESVNSFKSKLDKFGLCMTLYMTLEAIHLLLEVKCNSYIIMYSKFSTASKDYLTLCEIVDFFTKQFLLSVNR